MPLSTLTIVEILKMQFVSSLVSITGGLSFPITLEVVVTVMIVIVVLENLAVAAIVVVELIPMITGVQASMLISTHLTQIDNPISCLKSSMTHNWIIDSGANDHMAGNRGIKSYFTPTSYTLTL